MMIEKDRENEGHDEQQNQHVVVIGPDDQQKEETDQQDHELSRDYVREYRAHKEPVFTLKKRQTVRAMVPDVKRVGDDRRFPAGRTTQSQTTP